MRTMRSRTVPMRWVLALGALLASAGVAAKPQIQWDPNYDFSSIETFAWEDTAGASLERSEPFLHAHIVNAIEHQLTSYGFAETDSNPDVRVTYHSSVDRDVRLESTTLGYGFGRYGTPGWGRYGYGMRGPIYTDTRVVEVERGALVVDIWDAATNELIWRGKVDGLTVSSRPDKMTRSIDKAIKSMVKQADKLRKKANR